MRTWMLFLGGLVAAGALALPGEAEAQTRNRLIWFADEGGGANETYWIGVQAVPAPAVLRSHLKLKHGLLIEHVLPEGPAAEAGFAEGDILLTVGGEEVSDVKQLHDALQKSKGEAVSAVLLHEGEEREVKIAPAKRETPRGLVVGEGEPVERWLRGLRGAEGEDPIRMFLFRPGAVFGVPAGEELPANVKIEITKSGKEPAKITVTQGEEKWEATSEDLSALPEKIRTHVERMVGTRFQGRI